MGNTTPDINALIKYGKKIIGLDIKSSLERMDNDAEIWIEVIKVFVDTAPPLLESIKKINQQNLSPYTVTVHGLKSMCFNIGANAAGETARELENKSRSGDFVFVNENNKKFIKTMEGLTSGLSGLLKKLSEPKKPVKDKPDENVLALILEAAENFDIGNLEKNIDALDEFTYREESDLVLWLKEQCGISGFTAIQKRLAKT